MGGYIFIDRDSDEGLRHEMRRSMRSGSYSHDGYSPMMRGGEYERGYRTGYREATEDWEEDENYRRRRNSRGEFI
jgi:hypothetical protein